jgi:hypothetical protein
MLINASKYLYDMPIISMFYGLIVSMYYLDTKQHHLPHIHVRFQGNEAVYSIYDGTIIEGELAINKHKLVVAWIELHKDELLADWELAVSGQKIFPIAPLR